jgi:hypothetical protein
MTEPTKDIKGNTYIDIHGNTFLLEAPHLVWRDEEGGLGFLAPAARVQEVNIGAGEEGASAIQLFLRDEENDETLEYYFEFSGEDTARLLAEAILRMRAEHPEPEGPVST